MPRPRLSRDDTPSIRMEMRWPADLLSMVDAYAEQLGISRSEAIRRGMREIMATDAMCPEIPEG